MVVEKSPNGWINIFTTINGTLFQEKYLYYSKREAIRKFKEKYNLKYKRNL